MTPGSNDTNEPLSSGSTPGSNAVSYDTNEPLLSGLTPGSNAAAHNNNQKRLRATDEPLLSPPDSKKSKLAPVDEVFGNSPDENPDTNTVLIRGGGNSLSHTLTQIR